MFYVWFTKADKKLQQQVSLVDGIPFKLPVAAVNSPALMAVFPIDAEKAKDFLPAGIHPLRLWNSALLIVTVIDYRETPIGKYVEYSIAIGCTHGEKPAPRSCPPFLWIWFKTGQYVVDLPVSVRSVGQRWQRHLGHAKTSGGSLNFLITENKVSSQYDLDGETGDLCRNRQACQRVAPC